MARRLSNGLWLPVATASHGAGSVANVSDEPHASVSLVPRMPCIMTGHCMRP